MKIKSHSESHIVELDDGSRWRIFPAVVPSDNDVSFHVLVGEGAQVHVIAAGENWPVKEIKSVLKKG
jgi:hypothetical protein